AARARYHDGAARRRAAGPRRVTVSPWRRFESNYSEGRMTSDSDTGSAAGGNELSYKTAGVATGDAPPARRRVWFPVTLAAVYWIAAIGMARMEVSTFVRFLTLTAILAVV